jgi:hypothetical protein
MPPGTFAFALRATSVGARVGLTASISLLAADISAQLMPRHSGAVFALAGGTTALAAWRLLARLFRRLDV